MIYLIIETHYYFDGFQDTYDNAIVALDTNRERIETAYINFCRKEAESEELFEKKLEEDCIPPSFRTIRRTSRGSYEYKIVEVPDTITDPIPI